MIGLSVVARSFTRHNQSGAVIRGMDGARLPVAAGECAGRTGESGAGKSRLMRMIYGNRLAAEGRIIVCGVDGARPAPGVSPRLRRETLGHVSLFPGVVPGVPTREVVAAPLFSVGTPGDEALKRAEEPLSRLNIPERLRGLSPTTSPGGEPQRDNIAGARAQAYSALLLDEPTASCDPTRHAVMLGPIGDTEARARVKSRDADVSAAVPAQAA